MHNRNHSTVLSEEQLKQLLGSLPSVQAQASFEWQLLDRIGAEHLDMAHLLTKLSPVSAHPDFDARLFQAIREHKRTAPVIPTPFAGGTSFATLLKGFGWFRTGIAAGAAVVFAVGGTAVYNGLHDSSTPVRLTPAPTLHQPSTSPTPTASVPAVIGHGGEDETTSVSSQERGEKRTATENPMLSVPQTSGSDRTPVIKERSMSVKSPVTPSEEAEAQRGDQRLPATTSPAESSSTTALPNEPAGSVAEPAPVADDAPAVSIPTGDSVNTGRDSGPMEMNEETPGDSLRIRY